MSARASIVAALDLLGRDVGDRADERPLTGQAADRRDVLGEPEVAQVGVLARRPSCATRTLPGFTSRWTRPSACAASRALATWPTRSTARSRLERPVLLEDLAQVEPVDVAPSRGRASRRPRPWRRVGTMCGSSSARGDLRLAQEPVAEAGVVRELGNQHLERDLAALGVLCEIHRPGRAPPDQARDPVSGDDASGLEDVRHARAEPRGFPRLERALSRTPSRLNEGVDRRPCLDITRDALGAYDLERRRGSRRSPRACRARRGSAAHRRPARC